MRTLAAVALLTSSLALAEGGWVTSRGRLQPELRVEVFGATDSLGVGLVSPDATNPRAGLGLELVYAWRDRVIEVRGGRVWQLTPTQFATASATLGGVAFLVPDRFDAGAGLHGTLALALGGKGFTVDLAYEVGVDVFATAVVRIPQRGMLGLNSRFGDWGISLQAKAGADILPGAQFVGRGEVMLSLSWFGLGRSLRSEPR